MSGLVDYYDDLWENSGIPPYVQSILPTIEEASLSEGSKVLDIACGNGVLGKWLIERSNCEVHGIDISPVALGLCDKAGYKSTEIVELDKDTLPFPDDHFDLVTLSAVVEHIMEPEKVLANVWEKLKPGGMVVVLTPNISWIVNRFLFLAGRWDHRLMGGMKGHISYKNKKQLKEIFQSIGYTDLNWDHSVLCVAGNTKVCQSGISGFIIRALSNRQVKFMHSLFAFNFIVSARKPMEA